MEIRYKEITHTVECQGGAYRRIETIMLNESRVRWQAMDENEWFSVKYFTSSQKILKSEVLESEFQAVIRNLKIESLITDV
jgi:hypothetical protein